uniref:Uncharacterized protein n=1 Tax=Rhizophora mucronata TaxID=61149 RepID=A0A2P2PM32_RHIMU
MRLDGFNCSVVLEKGSYWMLASYQGHHFIKLFVFGINFMNLKLHLIIFNWLGKE